LIASGLANPTLMEIAPDGRIFVSEQGGRLRVIKNGSLLSTPFVTLNVSSSGERGLLGIAFDPNFSSNRYVYVYYTATSPTTHNRVSRFTASGDVAAGGETTLFDLDSLNATNHNGGSIHFGPDGKLYISAGDNAVSSNAQSLNTVLGKILRINSDGSIPTDNPFYGSTSGNNRAIWALGLRNPYTFAFNPQGGRMLINDVGEVSWEEINDGRSGANYGWPNTEGSTSDPRYLGPVHTYGHSGACAIAGGAFYSPSASQFPSDHYGDYFFADYCGWWIRRMDPSSGSVVSFATGIPMPVDLKVSSDGALYYLARGSGSTTGVVYKVEYGSGAMAPSITMHPASQTANPGASVTFSVGASGQQPLQYQWQRNGSNISGATGSSYTISSVTQSDNGARFRAVVSNSVGSVTSNEATLTVSGNQAPTGSITQPAAGTLYTAGSVVNYAGSGTDPEGGTLPASAFTWQIDFHHDQHVHPFIQPTTGSTSGSFTVPTTGHTEANVWFRIYLTVKDSAGLTHTSQRDVYPRKSQLTFATNPSGLPLSLDGQPITTPMTVDSVVGVIRTLEAPTSVTSGSTTYEFVSWSDGGAAGHTISTPASNTTYTATYRVTGNGGVGGGGGIHINFQTAEAPVPSGYLPDGGLVFGDRGNGQTYGWNIDNTDQTRDRNNPSSPDERYDTFAFMQWGGMDAVWEIAVPNGSYTVHVVGGDPTSSDGLTKIEVEGVLTASGWPSAADRWIEGTSTVTVSDGRLTIRSAPGASVNKLSFVDITPVGGGTSAPAISGVSPSAAAVGAVVTITGSGFGATQGSSSVRFNGTTAAPTSWSNNSISVPVPAGATSGPIVLVVGGASSNGVSFTVTSAPPPGPSISSLSPASGGIGAAVTIAGSNFGSSQGSSTVTFNGTPATPTSWNATSIVVTVPAGATTGSVVVTVGGQASSGVAFTVSTGTSGGGPLSNGRIGWWGPFQPGVAPTNNVAGQPNGLFVGSPTFTSDGGGAFKSTATGYLSVPDGGAGGVYDWRSGAWSVQIDFMMPSSPVWNGNGSLVLVSKGSFNLGTGWQIQVNDSLFQGKYQIMALATQGVNAYRTATAYLIAPGAFNRALFTCDTAGVGRWYVNGTELSYTQTCAPGASGATDLFVGRYSGSPDFASTFPIARVQIWNRALTAAEAAQSTTSDPQ
jgi:glucose/arabinose dehydrogenase